MQQALVKGEENGTYKSVEYFECKPGEGTFITKQQILVLMEKSIYINRITYGTKVYVEHPANSNGTVFYIGPKPTKSFSTWSNPVKDATYGVLLDNKQKTKVYVQRDSIEYPS